jgi:hypothetical protein
MFPNPNYPIYIPMKLGSYIVGIPSPFFSALESICHQVTSRDPFLRKAYSPAYNLRLLSIKLDSKNQWRFFYLQDPESFCPRVVKDSNKSSANRLFKSAFSAILDAGDGLIVGMTFYVHNV